MITVLPKRPVLGWYPWLVYGLGAVLPVVALLNAMNPQPYPGATGALPFAATYLIPGAVLVALLMRVHSPDGLPAKILAGVGVFLAFFAVFVVAIFVGAASASWEFTA